ncbi:alpha/beta hydrolase [Micromonospora sp. CPCC 205561]|uniref:alpha/beta hydrolase n=1 Tax=Micromonospora sp. CPCC 205561 TaxID=3122407 RepID=UPI002FF25426
MALITCSFHSEVLRTSTAMTVALPHPHPPAAHDTKPPPVLYLLHGLGDDETSWTRNSSIERHAAEAGIAVVMPRACRSFYTDEHHGSRYWTFLTAELPELVARLFRLSGRRQDTYVAGLSMGGYGAMRWALHHPERFAAAASLSGVLDVAHPTARQLLDQAVPHAFGPNELAGTDHDLLARLSTRRPGEELRLYIGCGTEDFTYPSNRRFADRARAAGWQVTEAFAPGNHQWGYWDTAIRDVLGWLRGPAAGSRAA